MEIKRVVYMDDDGNGGGVQVHLKTVNNSLERLLLRENNTLADVCTGPEWR